MKPDEAALWAYVVEGYSAREGGQTLGIHPKHVAYLCEKWASQGIYDYGISADLGWVVKP